MKTESKVKAASLSATVVGFILGALGLYVFHGEAPKFVSDFVELAVTSVGTGGAAWAAGWLAKHTPRA